MLDLTLALKLQHLVPPHDTATYFLLALAVLLNTPSAIADGAQPPVKKDPRLVPIYGAERVCNGVATSNDGTAFGVFLTLTALEFAQGLDASDTGISAAEVTLKNFEIWAYQVDPKQVSPGDPIDLRALLDGREELRRPIPD